METIQGLSNWKLTVRREAERVVILRAQTCDIKAVLPDKLFGLPVTVLGERALSPDAPPVAGEELRIICGREGEWNNRGIEELTLPAYLEEVRNYALFGCRSLKTLHLHDRADRWGGGCLGNCRALAVLHLTRVGEKQGSALASLCTEIHDELDVSIHETDGSLTRLVFPGYTEDYEENFANHFFDYSIGGGGYPYHHVFEKKQLLLKNYDELWEKYLREQYEPSTALRLAYTRLRWPAGLERFAEEQYSAYLRENAEAALLWQLSQKDSFGLNLLLECLQPDENILHLACERARKEGNTEALALLLERQSKGKPRGLERDFDL